MLIIRMLTFDVLTLLVHRSIALLTYCTTIMLPSSIILLSLHTDAGRLLIVEKTANPTNVQQIQRMGKERGL